MQDGSLLMANGSNKYNKKIINTYKCKKVLNKSDFPPDCEINVSHYH
jgi:hypothetical protein